MWAERGVKKRGRNEVRAQAESGAPFRGGVGGRWQRNVNWCASRRRTASFKGRKHVCMLIPRWIVPTSLSTHTHAHTKIPFEFAA